VAAADSRAGGGSRCGPVYKHVRFRSAVTYDRQQHFDLLARLKSLAREYREATGRPLGVTGEGRPSTRRLGFLALHSHSSDIPATTRSAFIGEQRASDVC
jgi:hypothetical protein